MSETRADLPPVVAQGGMRLALNVRTQGIRPELLLGLMIVSDMCTKYGAIVVITALLNGHHMKNSLHYTGAAVDFTLALVPDRDAWVVQLRESLGEAFDVIDEGTHIHIEYQPHHGATT